MNISFTKMQACGNDYIYLNCFDTAINNPQALSIQLSQRRFSVGADGIVLILPSDVADAKMRIFNSDGSEGKMCGNAIRCVAKYLYENHIVSKRSMRIESISGIKTVALTEQDGQIASITVDMGKPVLTPSEIPVNLAGASVIAQDITIDGICYNITCVSMGNPHAVLFCKDVDAWDLPKIGHAFEYDPLFPDRVNLELAEIIGPNHIKMRVWERGSGETFACGTGACAAAVAAVLNGLCDKDTAIKVAMPGGALIIKYTDNTVYMTGNAEKTFEGVVTL